MTASQLLLVQTIRAVEVENTEAGRPLSPAPLPILRQSIGCCQGKYINLTIVIGQMDFQRAVPIKG